MDEKEFPLEVAMADGRDDIIENATKEQARDLLAWIATQNATLFDQAVAEVL